MSTPRLIAIAGGSGSGKSRLARLLHETLAPVAAILTLDHFYQDLAHLPPEERESVNFDDPAAIDWAEVDHTLDAFLAGRAVEVPQYDFASHTRAPEGELLEPRPLLLLDGLWTLSRPEIREAAELTIFVDCPTEVRLERRIRRDMRERGRTEESVRRQFEDHVEPMHARHVQPQIELADIVLTSPIRKGRFQRLLRHPSLRVA